VGIAGALVFAVPVSAQADMWDVAWFELSAVAAEGGAIGGVIGEGVIAAAPAVGEGFACAAALPVCAAVGGAVVGAAMYLTKDTWLPWVQNGLGFALNTFSGSGCTATTLPNQQAMLHVTNDVNDTVPVRVHTESAGGCWSGYNLTATCQRADGTQYVEGPSFSGWGNYSGAYDRDYQACGGAIGNHLIIYDAAFGSGAPDSGVSAHWEASGGGVVATMKVSCTNPDGSQYEVTSAVPAVNGMVELPTCTGAVGDAGGGRAHCASLMAGTDLPSSTVQSSNCVAAGTAGLLYPECMAAGCIYRVVVDGIACTVGRPGCTDWARTYATSPGRVGCRYGVHPVSVDHCFFMERVYEDGMPVPATLGNTDGDPATYTGTAPAPSTNPQPQPIPNGAPGGDPGTLPGGGTAPLPSPGSDPQTNGDCWSGGSFSWNPVDWVMVPTKCALSWAFVPKTAALTGLAAAAQTDLTTQGIGPIVNAVNVNVQKVGGGGGCDGPAVTFAAVGIEKPMHPFSACTAPMSTLAGISYAMTTVVVILGGGFVAVKAIGAGFGFNFSMRRGGGDSV